MEQPQGGGDSSAELTRLQAERDQVQEDLEKTETAFADLHSKYGKVKEVVENFKKNDAILKDALAQSQVSSALATPPSCCSGAFRFCGLSLSSC